MTFKIPAGVLDQHVIALGKTGSGKSSKLRVLVEQLLRAEEPVCILDVKGDWWGLKSSADGKRAGFPLVIFGGKHADVPLSAGSGKEIAELVFTGNRPCIIDMRALGQGERARFFIDLASTAYKVTKGKRWVVMSEVHNFCPKGKIFSPQAGEMLHWANKLASEGRGLGLNLLADSQRGQKVHNDFLTSMETLIACKVIHKSDRDAIKDWIDGCADIKVGKQVLDSLAQLKKPEGWVWCPEIDFGPELLQFPLFETFDSFKHQPADAPAQLKGWATVDLEELKSKLATVLEEAKANDPAALKKRIAELEREAMHHKNLAKIATAAAPDLRDLDRATKEGYEAGFRKGQGHIVDQLELYYGSLEHWSKDMPRPPVFKIDAPRESVVTFNRPPPKGLKFTVSTPVRTPVTTGAKSPRTNGQESTLSGVQQRILNALAEAEQLSAEAPDRSLVAILSGYTHIQSTGFVKALGALSSGGMITYPPGGRVALTDAGRELAVAPDAPTTARELQDRVSKLIGGAASKVLRPLIEANREPMSRQALAEASGYGHVQSTGFVKTIGRLRTLGFIDYPASGMVVAQPVLFLE